MKHHIQINFAIDYPDGKLAIKGELALAIATWITDRVTHLAASTGGRMGKITITPVKEEETGD